MTLSRSALAATVILAALGPPALKAQETVDHSTASRVSPYPIRTFFPGACRRGDMMTYQPGTPGSDVYICGNSNDWNQLTPPSSGGTWGSITGTLSAQTDLNTALAAKAATSSLAPVATSGSATDLSTGTLPHARLPALVSGDIPNNAANTSGQAATALALAATPTPCSSGQAPTGVLANGNSTGCVPTFQLNTGSIVCDGSTDTTAAFQAALNANATIFLPLGTCVISNITLTQSNAILGFGPGTILKFKTGSTGYMIDASTFALRLRDIDLDGGNNSDQSGTSSAGNRSGVHINAQAQVGGSSWDRVSIHGFTNNGIGFDGTAGGEQDWGPVLSGCSLYYNYIGINTNVSSPGEGALITGNRIFRNRIGVQDSAGNTQVNSNNITYNGYGIQMTTVSNPGHGTIQGNLIDHSTVDSLSLLAQSAGELIQGNVMIGAAIVISGTQITVTENQLNVGTITLTGNGGNNQINSFTRNFITAATTINTNAAWIMTDNPKYDGTWLQGMHSQTTSPAISLGSELITNGSFSSGSSWTVGAGWAISGNAANATAANGLLWQASVGTQSLTQTYEITFTISSYTSGSVNFQMGGGGDGSAFYQSAGTYHAFVTLAQGTDGNFYIKPLSFTGSITGVSVKLATVTYPVSYVNPLGPPDIYTVSTLPTCNTNAEGKQYPVSDLTTPTYLATAVGGGAVHGPVYCDGTNWVTP